MAGMRRVVLFVLCVFAGSAEAHTNFKVGFNDPHTVLNFFVPQDHTFNCNQTQFNPKNVVPVAPANDQPGRLQLALTTDPFGQRKLSGAEVAVIPEGTPDFMHGRYEFRMKTSCASGTVSAVFLFRHDPWQEIDIEILGKDPSRLQTSIVYNPGPAGAPNNKPNYTPKLINLGFNSCEAFHDYAIEWAPGRVRWFADGKIIDDRQSFETTPNLPMTLRMNGWASCSSGWAGHFDPKTLPSRVEFESVGYTSL